MSRWYTCYVSGGANVMHLCQHRDDTIDAACELLRQGFNVTEIGPMIGIREGNVLRGDEIRRIWEERITADQDLLDHSAQNPVGAV